MNKMKKKEMTMKKMGKMKSKDPGETKAKKGTMSARKTKKSGY
jgi:hypothetical protein